MELLFFISLVLLVFQIYLQQIILFKLGFINNFVVKDFQFLHLELEIILDFSIPDIIENNLKCLLWIRKNSEKYGIEIHKIGLLGISSGGFLALSTSLAQTKIFDN